MDLSQEEIDDILNEPPPPWYRMSVRKARYVLGYDPDEIIEKEELDKRHRLLKDSGEASEDLQSAILTAWVILTDEIREFPAPEDAGLEDAKDYFRVAKHRALSKEALRAWHNHNSLNPSPPHHEAFEITAYILLREEAEGEPLNPKSLFGAKDIMGFFLDEVISEEKLDERYHLLNRITLQDETRNEITQAYHFLLKAKVWVPYWENNGYTPPLTPDLPESLADQISWAYKILCLVEKATYTEDELETAVKDVIHYDIWDFQYTRCHDHLRAAYEILSGHRCHDKKLSYHSEHRQWNDYTRALRLMGLSETPPPSYDLLIKAKFERTFSNGTFQGQGRYNNSGLSRYRYPADVIFSEAVSRSTRPSRPKKFPKSAKPPLNWKLSIDPKYSNADTEIIPDWYRRNGMSVARAKRVLEFPPDEHITEDSLSDRASELTERFTSHDFLYDQIRDAQTVIGYELSNPKPEQLTPEDARVYFDIDLDASITLEQLFHHMEEERPNLYQQPPHLEEFHALAFWLLKDKYIPGPINPRDATEAIHLLGFHDDTKLSFDVLDARFRYLTNTNFSFPTKKVIHEVYGYLFQGLMELVPEDRVMVPLDEPQEETVSLVEPVDTAPALAEVEQQPEPQETPSLSPDLSFQDAISVFVFDSLEDLELRELTRQYKKLSIREGLSPDMLYEVDAAYVVLKAWLTKPEDMTETEARIIFSYGPTEKVTPKAHWKKYEQLRVEEYYEKFKANIDKAFEILLKIAA